MVDYLRIPPDARLDSVRRRLGQANADHVALVVPDGWTELADLARLRVLQRQAQIQGIELGLVTTDRATRKAAKRAGIPVFKQAEQAGNGNWAMAPLSPTIDPQHPDATLPEPPPWRRDDVIAQRARPSRYQARQRRIAAEERYRRPTPLWMQWLGTLLMAGVIGVFLLFFILYVLPAATVTMVPGRTTLSVTVPLTADANVDVADVEGGVIPARLVETTIEKYGTIATTGSQQKPTDKSTGQVTFSNLGNEPVRIPLNTEVTTSSGAPVSFRTTNEAELPGGVGQRVTVPIEAVEPGVSSNVRAGTINTVSGPLRFRARVTNQDGTFGGGSQLVPVVTQTDQEALLERLLTEIEQEAYPSLATDVTAGEWLDPESVQTFVLAQVFDQFRDDEATELGLTLRVLAQGVAVDLNDMNDALLGALQDEVPDRGQIIASSFRTERLPGSVSLGRATQFTSTAAAEIIIPIDPVQVKHEITGMTPDAAAAKLQQDWQLSGPPEIYQDPDWRGVLPRFPNRIQVRVEYQGALAAEQ